MFNLEVEQLVATRLLSVLPKARIARGNMNFSPPNDTWVRLIVQNSISQISSITGNPRIVDYGLITLQIFNKENTGTGGVKLLAKSLTKAIGLDPIPNIVINPPTLVEVGAENNNGFYQHNLIFNYQYHGAYE